MTKPMPFQKRAVRRIEQFDGRALVASEMGLGKSFMSLLFIHRNPDALPACVVCPASLKWNWESEAKKHIGLPAEVLEGTRPPRRFRRLHDPHRLVILNFDILWAWLPYLKSLGLRTIIVDELQYVKSKEARRTKNTKELCRGVPYVLGLSGTPLVNRPAELWAPLDIVLPGLFPSYFKFCFRFTAPKRTPYGWDFRGASNLDRLHAILRENGMVRYRKADVLRDLPEKSRQVLPLDLSDPKEYRRAQQHFIQWLRETRGDAKARKAKRAQRVVQMGYLRRLAAQGKLPQVFDWLDLFLASSDEKLLVFAVHREVIGAIHERYARQSVVVDGSVTGRQRKVAFAQFLRNPKTRLLIGNIQAAGVGWSAKGVANVVLVELPWTPGELTQAEDRCHGIGRGQEGVHTNIHLLVARGTIEEKLLEILQRKQAVLTQTLDGRGRGDDLDVYDLLERALLEQQAGRIGRGLLDGSLTG